MKKTQSIALIALFTALIALSSWLYVPFAVPITLQTFAVCLASAMLKKKAVISVLSYVLLGLVGVPVFAGFQSGASVIFNITGGYIIGFVFTSLIVGFLCEKAEGSIIKLTALMLFGILSCYLFGTLWFTLFFDKTGASLVTALLTCVVPFIIPDILKAFLAATLYKKLKKQIQL